MIKKVNLTLTEEEALTVLNLLKLSLEEHSFNVEVRSVCRSIIKKTNDGILVMYKRLLKRNK